MRVLVVEDEKKVAAFIKKGMEVKGYDVDVAFDGEMGLHRATNGAYDLVILDLNLPLINGFQVCRQLRQQNSRVPVLMLTALGSVKDKVTGFESGADDYLVKPFEFEELLARAKVMIMRNKAAPVYNNVLRVSNLSLDKDKKTVHRHATEIVLTAKEFLLLEYLMENEGKVLSRNDIARKIWDISFDTGTNVIDLYIYYLRRKVDKDFLPKLIHTQIGMGYVLKIKE